MVLVVTMARMYCIFALSEIWLIICLLRCFFSFVKLIAELLRTTLAVNIVGVTCGVRDVPHAN